MNANGAYSSLGTRKALVMEDLGYWLARASTAEGASLDRLEEDVWSRVKAIQSQRATERIRLAAVALALLVGIANGGLGAKFAQTTASSEMSVFTAAAMSPLARMEVG
ncbi:hypothetical protein [Brevundimonas sp.]|uniref:hypothetical protein n=2 Tax=Brevundimonas TaxID=41275 RepID=UPI00289BF85E|nr:hypothetical protein [Brevundimonas sp.]